MALQDRTLLQIRQSVGYILNDMVLVEASTNGDTSSLIAAYSLGRGGDDEYNGRQLYAATMTGSIAAGEKSWISDFVAASFDATVAPVFSAATAGADIFEMWKVFRVEEINDAINQVISDITAKALQIKTIRTAFTETDKYLYDALSGFTHLSLVEYVSSIGTTKEIHRCDVKWDELEDTDVTASLDTSFKKEGGGSVKLEVAAGAGAGDILLTDNITEVDLSNTTEVQIWIYSTVALDAGDLQLLLDDTVQCASPVESLNIPATTANTWTRHIITLANPQSDSAVISVGLKMVVDKGAFNMWVDDIKALDELTNQYKELPIEYWGIAQGATPYLMLTRAGLSLAGVGTQLRLTGFQIPALLTSDSATSEIDPAYLTAKTAARLLVSHAKSSQLDIHDRAKLATFWLGEAGKRETGITTSMPGTTRVIKP